MKNPLETSHAFLILLKRCVNNFFKRGFVFTPQLCRSNTIYIQEKKSLKILRLHLESVLHTVMLEGYKKNPCFLALYTMYVHLKLLGRSFKKKKLRIRDLFSLTKSLLDPID